MKPPHPKTGMGATISKRSFEIVSKGKPSEADVARWWHQGAYSRVVTTRGRSLQVLYPGRPSPQAGPDFRDSLLATEEGELIRGDVEVHLRQGDWVGHGHHQDPRYRDVVLHLFLQGKRSGALPEIGAQVQEVALGMPQPAALLEKAPRASRRPETRHRAAPLERLRTLTSKELERVLDEAGESRFMTKALGMMERIRRGDPEGGPGQGAGGGAPGAPPGRADGRPRSL